MTTNPPKTEFAHETALWRAAAEQHLRAEDGWLAVCGLHWLEQGETSFGGDATCDLKLPSGSARAGVFARAGNAVQVLPGDGPITFNNSPLSGPATLRDDADGPPDKLRMGAISMVLLRRGNRIGVRVWDNVSPARLNFGGRRWHAPDERYRVQAHFVADQRPIKITNVLGDVSDAISPGWIEFELLGKTHRLSVESSDIGRQLFINFKDATSGKTTYGASRFLYTGGVQNGTVAVDFNQATSPPCAFTAFATCPLPRRENIVPVEIEAGELHPPAD